VKKGETRRRGKRLKRRCEVEEGNVGREVSK
jgi:hypothetical protein